MSLTLLALDTSTEACSVALLHKGERTFQQELAQRTHTQRILPMIDNILSQSGIKLNQVDGLVFGRGPGSFTGVRVGVGIAQGLALGADLPVIPVSNLTAMAQAAYEEQQAEYVLSAIDARMGEVYFSALQARKVRLENQEFLVWQELIKEQVCAPEKVVEQCQELPYAWTTTGTGWAAYSKLTSLDCHNEIILPNAKYMLSLALYPWSKKQVMSALEIEPIYLRNEVTWKKLPGK